MKKLFVAVPIALLALSLMVLSVSASTGVAQTDPTAPDLKTFLQWLIGGPGSILAVSWILERIPWFQARTAEQKDYIVFACAAVVGCAALAVVMYVPQPVLDAIAPFFLILSSIFVTVFVMKLFHRADKLPQ